MKYLVIFFCLLLVLGCDRPVSTGAAKQASGGKGPGGQQEQVAVDDGLGLHETYIYGQKQFASQSAGALRVMVKRAKTLTESVPAAGAKVKVMLYENDRPQLLYQGQTSENGEADVRFNIPELKEGAYKLEVYTKSACGEEKIEQSIHIVEKQKILLVTDKPLYQPGQQIHIRALSLNQLSLKPVTGKELLLEVEDSKSNKVFKKRVNTGDYGIAYAIFQLADEVNTGAYHIRAKMGKNKANKTVIVKKYVLPKFKLGLDAEKRYFMPGDKVKGKVRADYFFGKPVAGGKVKLTASTFDVEFKEFAKLQGITGEDGSYQFEFKLPGYFVGQPLEKGDALLKLDIEVTDKAEHVEKKTATYPVAKQPIRIAAVPESGKLAPGVENRIYVITSYPDGRPCLTSIEAKHGKNIMTATTDSAGIAVLTLHPENTSDISLTLKARDKKGASAEKQVKLSCVSTKDTVLLRPGKSIYRAGETIDFSVLSTFSGGDVYLDVIKDRQTVCTRTVTLKHGQGRTALPATSDLFGTLECHAYKLLTDGNFVRDTRIVYVQPPADIKISVRPNKQCYRPGEKANIDLFTSDTSGKPLPAALGISIVDEAVYALQEMQPGLEKVYFTLEKELSSPKYQIKYGPAQSLQGLVMQERYDDTQQKAAAVLFAKAGEFTTYTWKRNPALIRKQQLQSNLQAIFNALVSYAASFPVGCHYPDGHWGYQSDILATMVKKQYLDAKALKHPFKGEFSLKELERLDPAFSYDLIGTFDTCTRLRKTYEALYNHWYKTKKDPKSITFGDLVKAGKLKGSDLIDAWGNELRRKIVPGNQNRYYYWELREVVISSVGPDGKPDTADDILYVYPYDALSNQMRQSGKSTSLMINYWGPMKENEWMEVEEDGVFMEKMALADNVRNLRGNGGQIPVPKNAMPENTSASLGKTPSKSASPRIRDYFPETLLFQPKLITDENGKATLDVDMADSITTWRLSANANSRGGLLGGTTSTLRVFQDFFVDIDFPVALTQNDEVSVPVAIFNYLAKPQKVKLQVTKEDWFELVDDAEKTVTMNAKDVGVVYFRIKAKKIGDQRFTVMAYGSKMSDAVRREVEIVPDGKRVETVINGYLSKNLEQKVTIPKNSVPGASKIIVKCYPGVGAVLVEGLGGMLRMPHG